MEDCGGTYVSNMWVIHGTPFINCWMDVLRDHAAVSLEPRQLVCVCACLRPMCEALMFTREAVMRTWLPVIAEELLCCVGVGGRPL